MVKFSNANLTLIGRVGLVLSGVSALVICVALTTGNYDRNIVSLIPSTIFGVGIFFAMKAVIRNRSNGNAG